MDVEATTAIRQAEVGAAKTMLDRTAAQFDLTPLRLVADGGYGSAEMVGWLVDERRIEPHVKVFEKSERTDGTFSREPPSPTTAKATSMFAQAERASQTLPPVLFAAVGRHQGQHDHLPRQQLECSACALKSKCCPNMPARKIARSVHEAAFMPCSPRSRI